MAYSPFVIGNPDGSTGDGSTFAAQLQTNLAALVHAVVMGEFRGWNFAAAGGTGAAPATLTWSTGVYRVRATPTWNVNGNPDAVLWEYSSNSGSSYDAIGTVTYTYDGDLNVTAATWS